MTTSNPIQSTLEAYAKQSYAGTINFPTLVGKLIELGVESYFADYRQARTIYYLSSGETVSIVLNVPATSIPAVFQMDGIIEAVRNAQKGILQYPAFLEHTMLSGCVGYFVWIAGRCVHYLGARGETHIEHFPPVPSEQ